MPEPHIFDKKNILVTGGAGFIGSFLCERLLRDGHRVICVDDFSTSGVENINVLMKNPDFEFLRADINQPLDLSKFPELDRFKFKFQGIQEIYHLACPMAVKDFEKFRQHTMLANSVGMRNVLDLALEHKAKFLQASSSIVYGPRVEDSHLIREDEGGCAPHLTPRSCYDIGKLWAETMAETYRQVHGLEIRIARIFRTYGPRMPIFDGHMIPDFILNGLEGKPLVIYGTESFRTSLLYVGDAVDAMVRLMSHPVDPGPVNVGSDLDLRIVDVANRIIEMTGSKSEIVFEDPLLFMIQLNLPDLTKVKDTLGWIPMVSLEQGLKKSIEYTIASKGLLRTVTPGK
ncbi:NAD-dependent epimerase/dehydratase family protein [Candidatus Uhrbacteria bacterium]|nr:NAD-dependent epimerase/dehydratase family protein [Candidatus Uhrbacteria bacterium]